MLRLREVLIGASTPRGPGAARSLPFAECPVMPKVVLRALAQTTPRVRVHATGLGLRHLRRINIEWLETQKIGMIRRAALTTIIVTMRSTRLPSATATSDWQSGRDILITADSDMPMVVPDTPTTVTATSIPRLIMQ